MPSARSTMVFLAARCAPIVTCCHWQPPQVPNSGHGGGTRSGPGRSIADQLAPGDLPLLALERTRTRSPGAASGTNVTRPSSARPRALPALLPPDGVAAGRERVDLDADRSFGTSRRLRERLRGAPALQIEVEVAAQHAADDGGDGGTTMSRIAAATRSSSTVNWNVARNCSPRSTLKSSSIAMRWSGGVFACIRCTASPKLLKVM